MGTRALKTLTMDMHELEAASPSYDQVVAAWAIFCLTFTGQSELSHTYAILDTDAQCVEVRTSQSDKLMTCRSQLLREICVIDGDTVKTDQEISGIFLETAQLGGSLLAELLKEICPGSGSLALLVTHGQRFFYFAELDLPQPHFVCRIEGNAIKLQTVFLEGISASTTAQIQGLADSFCFFN